MSYMEDKAGLSIRELMAGEDDLEPVKAALVREVTIRRVMAETGEPREVVVEAIDASDAMADEAILDLTEGEPTTLHDGLRRYIDDLAGRDWASSHEIGAVLADLSALLNYRWPGPAATPPSAIEEGAVRLALHNS